MGVHTKLPDSLHEVDIIVAGGGTAGCVVASRLADADPGLTILVIESGRDNFNVPTVVHPVLWRGNYVPSDPRVFFHKAVKEHQLADRESIVQVGNTLGGGSSVNLMMYTRAQRCDYDSWNTKGWTTDEVLPFLKKFETYDGSGNEELHGSSGPIRVSRGPFRSTEAEQDFISAMKVAGYPEVEDLQDLTSLGVSRIRKYVSPQGQRQDAAHRYLHPGLEKHPNLHVLVESKVVRVTFDNDRRASGVEYQPQSDKSLQRTVNARKLVVVSCGTLGSPPVLERSGVGNAEVLKSAGVPLVAELPGVGHDYQDHNISIYVWSSRLPPEETTDGIHGGYVDIPALLSSKDKILGWNGIDVSSKVRPTDAEVEALGPSYQEAWKRDFEKTPSKPVASMIFIAGLLGDRSRVPPGQYFSVGIYTTYPYSRGSIHITGSQVDDPLDFKTGFLSDEQDLDLKTQMWAYKKQREVVRRMAIHRGEVSYRHPVFAPGSTASYVDETGDADSAFTPSAVTDLKYAPEDDAAIEQWIRQNMTTCWHGLGTCKMAPREQMGVVDENLDVYGVHGLKIADLSIAPENVCCNTMNTALMIGEKAADIIIRQLGLSH
ncbi:alcohol oxidase-like protein [Camillea tinctor]|nr:alcohol oxidase-like protein [Camillea tinctor]